MEYATLSQWRLESRRGEPTRANAWYQPTMCAREKRAWVEEDAYGRTHKEACGPPVSYRDFSARGDVPGAVGPSAPPDSLEEYRAAVGEFPLERGYVFAGRRIPPLRELCARALPIGTEIPPT